MDEERRQVASSMYSAEGAGQAAAAAYATEGAGQAAQNEESRKKRRWVLLFLLLLLIVTVVSLSLANRMSPVDLAIMYADQVGITHNNAEARATVEGTTSFQSPNPADTRWTAGSTSQHFVMANPSGNEVALAPHIYVDLDRDGEFSEGECIYNAIEYGRSGDVTSYGEFIDVGWQIEDIEIAEPLPAGDYRAKVSYTAVDKETRVLCNGNDFVFDLAVV